MALLAGAVAGPPGLEPAALGVAPAEGVEPVPFTEPLTAEGADGVGLAEVVPDALAPGAVIPVMAPAPIVVPPIPGAVMPGAVMPVAEDVPPAAPLGIPVPAPPGVVCAVADAAAASEAIVVMRRNTRMV